MLKKVLLKLAYIFFGIKKSNYSAQEQVRTLVSEISMFQSQWNESNDSDLIDYFILEIKAREKLLSRLIKNSQSEVQYV
jgi:hypothetical protein